MKQGWQSVLLAAWLRRGPLALALLPLSWLYRGLLALRWHTFAWGWRRSQRLPVPVVVVGNVVIGGVGKTPIVIALVQALQQRGWVVGVVSRGYGRQGDDCREVHVNDDADAVGDEALLLRRRTGVPVFVAGKRVLAGHSLLKAYANTQIIVCDDGLQHLALARDVELCVFDDRGAGNGFLLPAGLLREPWPRRPLPARLGTPDFCVLHSGERPAFAGLRVARRLADFAVRADGSRLPLAELAASDLPLLALAGIAQPQRFFDQLRERGLMLNATQALGDHHSFKDWTAPPGVQIVCTEKDAVKLWPRFPQALAVPLIVELPPELVDRVESRVRAKLSSGY